MLWRAIEMVIGDIIGGIRICTTAVHLHEFRHAVLARVFLSTEKEHMLAEMRQAGQLRRVGKTT